MDAETRTLITTLRAAPLAVDHDVLVTRCHQAADKIERLVEQTNRERHAVVHHSRWLETDEPRATVIRSADGEIWHEVCTTDPETAEEIAWALDARSELARVDRVLALAVTELADTSGRGWQQVLDGLEREERAQRDPRRIITEALDGRRDSSPVEP